MGFGFNLAFIYIFLPLTVILLIVWLISKKKIFSKILLFIWAGLIGLIIMVLIVERMTSKVVLKKKDFYGSYIIDKKKFPGKQADWQYDNFRFEIKRNDSIFFYVNSNGAISQTFKGVITTLKIYKSHRLIVDMEQPSHHILTTSPTIYRDTWSFYLVFNSPKFGNMFFKKGDWESRN